MVYYLGKAPDLNVFAVKFTPNRLKLNTSKVNAMMLGYEGFAVNAKAAAGWVFVESGEDLNIRPKDVTKGKSDRIEAVYANGSTVRLLFPNGKSITAGGLGNKKRLIVSLENHEPRISK